MKVILISGKARHGKDTAAGILQLALAEEGQSALIAHLSLFLVHRKRLRS